MTAAAADAEVIPQSPGPGRLDPDTIRLITEQARQARPGHALLTFLGSILFAIGWAVAKFLGVVFLSFAWCFTAVRIGWRSARGEPLTQPDINSVLAENERLRAAVQRLGG